MKIENFMRIIVSQQGKKILITLGSERVAAHKVGEPRPEKSGRVDKFIVDKAEDFLTVVDKFLRRRNIGRIGRIEFENTGILTERVIRSIMLGLRFSISKLAQN